MVVAQVYNPSAGQIGKKNGSWELGGSWPSILGMFQIKKGLFSREGRKHLRKDAKIFPGFMHM